MLGYGTIKLQGAFLKNDELPSSNERQTAIEVECQRLGIRAVKKVRVRQIR